MKNLIIKEGYKSKLDLIETEKAIKFCKDTFQVALAKALNLTRVSAPLFVSDKDISDFIASRKEWILKKQELNN